MPWHRAPGAVAETVDDRAVILDPSGSEIITLNPVGSLVWESLATPSSLDQLVDGLAAKFPDVRRDTLAADVSAFLSELEGLGLVSARDD